MLNIIVLAGRMVADPELMVTDRKRTFVNFRLAVDRNYTPRGKEKETDFINCVAWEKTAEFVAKHFHKGDMIAVQGELHSRSYDDKQGIRRTAYDVSCSTVHFTGDKPKKEAAASTDAPDISAAEDYDEIAENF